MRGPRPPRRKKGGPCVAGAARHGSGRGVAPAAARRGARTRPRYGTG